MDTISIIAQPTAKLRCACGAIADIKDDRLEGVAYCARCWLAKEGIAIEVSA